MPLSRLGASPQARAQRGVRGRLVAQLDPALLGVGGRRCVRAARADHVLPVRLADAAARPAAALVPLGPAPRAAVPAAARRVRARGGGRAALPAAAAGVALAKAAAIKVLVQPLSRSSARIDWVMQVDLKASSALPQAIVSMVTNKIGGSVLALLLREAQKVAKEAAREAATAAGDERAAEQGGPRGERVLAPPRGEAGGVRRDGAADRDVLRVHRPRQRGGLEDIHLFYYIQSTCPITRAWVVDNLGALGQSSTAHPGPGN